MCVHVVRPVLSQDRRRLCFLLGRRDPRPQHDPALFDLGFQMFCSLPIAAVGQKAADAADSRARRDGNRNSRSRRTPRRGQRRAGSKEGGDGRRQGGEQNATLLSVVVQQDGVMRFLRSGSSPFGAIGSRQALPERLLRSERA
jgi:hypothetical protein